MTQEGLIERRDAWVFVTYKGKTVQAEVYKRSPNGKSVILRFDAMLGGYVGMMPIMWEEMEPPPGRYVDLIEQQPLVVTPYPS